MNKPVLTTVIALNLATPPGDPDVAATFNRVVVAAAKTIGATSQDPGALNLTIIVSPDASADSALQRLGLAVGEFESQTNIRVRMVMHHGVVFRNESADGRISYMGSAIKGAQTLLGRLGSNLGAFASKDFASYAPGAKLSCLALEPSELLVDGELWALRFASGPKKAATKILSGSDAALIAFLKNRLAQEIGPFAGPLVDNASHTSHSAKDLAAALSHEIDNIGARSRFDHDVAAYIKSRTS